MSADLLPKCVALSSALTWATATLLYRRGIERVGNTGILVLRNWVAATSYALWLTLSGSWTELSTINAQTFAGLIGSALLAIGIGDFFYLKSIRQLGLAPAAAMGTTYPLFTLLLGVIFDGRGLTAFSVLGILIVMAGVMGIILSRHAPGDGSARKHRLSDYSPMLITVICWGGAAVGLGHASKGLSLAAVGFVRYSTFALLWIPWLFGRAGRETLRRIRTERGLELSAACFIDSVLGASLYIWPLSRIDISVASSLNSTSPLFVVPLGYFFLKEKTRPATLAAILVTMAGVVLTLLKG